jgi:carboxyl-terminal processing protease
MLAPIAAILAVAVGSADPRENDVNDSTWHAINADSGYVVEAADVPAGDAATISVWTERDATGKVGGAIKDVDASPYRGSRVTISGDLAAGPGTKGAAVWMRADGAAGRLKFATSARFPVHPGQDAVRRGVSFRVPAQADRLVFGLVMNGNGKIEAREFRMTVEPAAESTVKAADVLDAAVEIVRTNALNSDQVDWTEVAARVRDVAARADQPEDTYPAIRMLLSLLKDGHSFHMDPDAVRQHELMAAPSVPPVVKLLPGGRGYVLIPGFAGRNDDDIGRFVKSVSDGMRAIAPDATGGWIVDLRENSGGNMWPMLTSLAPLLGTGTPGSFRGRDGQLRPWVVTGDDTGLSLVDAPVAVLLGERTNSAGEAVAVAFHGRPRTRMFGQKTAGRSTSNANYPLPDGSQLLLTTAVTVSRNGTAFGGAIEPDEAVPPAEARGRDPALDAAIVWLDGT